MVSQLHSQAIVKELGAFGLTVLHEKLLSQVYYNFLALNEFPCYIDSSL